MEKSKEIFVTRPDLPKLNDFVNLLEDIWESKWLTNNAKYHKKFEKELADYLGVKFVSLFSNGTLALLSALHVLRITGEVITTPYSFVATTHALYWNRIKPVFCDIESETFNIDADKIESLITPKTTAILPVHIYGNPCNLKKLHEIAKIYGFKIIYDACHAFGVKVKDVSILNFGDLAVLSFHATKVFNTMEGGAIVCHNKETKKRIDFIKNFGFANETTVLVPGINAKMNEMQAALGLLQLKEIEKNIKKRKLIVNQYRNCLNDVKGIKFLKDMEGVKHNYSYFPIFINEKEYGKARDALYEELKKHKIYCRRYFYPLISHFPMYKNLPSATPEKLPIAEKATKEVICLPIYPELGYNVIKRITDIIKG